MRNELNKMVADVKDQTHRKVRQVSAIFFSPELQECRVRSWGFSDSDGALFHITYFEAVCCEPLLVSCYILGCQGPTLGRGLAALERVSANVEKMQPSEGVLAVP
jgi:hypothetical protein